MNTRLKALIFFLCMTAYWRFVIMPINNKTESYKKSIIAAQNDLSEIDNVIAKNNYVTAGINDVIQRFKFFPRNISFIGFIENELSKISVRNKIDKLIQKDSVSAENYIINIVSLKLNDISLIETLDIFELFNSAGYMIKTSYFEIKKNSNSRFSATFELQALASKQ